MYSGACPGIRKKAFFFCFSIFQGGGGPAQKIAEKSLVLITFSCPYTIDNEQESNHSSTMFRSLFIDSLHQPVGYMSCKSEDVLEQ